MVLPFSISVFEQREQLYFWVLKILQLLPRLITSISLILLFPKFCFFVPNALKCLPVFLMTWFLSFLLSAAPLWTVWAKSRSIRPRSVAMATRHGLRCLHLGHLPQALTQIYEWKTGISDQSGRETRLTSSRGEPDRSTLSLFLPWERRREEAGMNEEIFPRLTIRFRGGCLNSNNVSQAARDPTIFCALLLLTGEGMSSRTDGGTAILKKWNPGRKDDDAFWMLSDREKLRLHVLKRAMAFFVNTLSRTKHNTWLREYHYKHSNLSCSHKTHWKSSLGSLILQTIKCALISYSWHRRC